MKTSKLGDAEVGARGRIKSVASTEKGSETRVNRLLESGFVEGSPFEVENEAPIGGDPIAVRIRGSLIAIRREDANLIEVEWTET